LENRKKIENFFLEQGILSKNFPDYEFRTSQTEMALSIYDCLLSKEHIFIEAPTGIGKSFAYLVPSIYYAKKYQKKAVISTNTINLQEQLIFKDIPFLKDFLPIDFKASLIKGKNNYICPHRLRKAMNNTKSLFDEDETKILDKIYDWFLNTKDGTTSDINFKVPDNLWSNICAEHGICTSKTCGGEDTECFYQKAKFDIAKSDIVIINHYLFFTLFRFNEYKRKSRGTKQEDGYLFHNDFLIFDEAQTLENIAAKHLYPTISREMIKYHLTRLYNDKKRKGFLNSFNSLHIIPTVINLLELNNLFFQTLKKKYYRHKGEKEPKTAARIYERNSFENILNDEFNHLIKCLRPLRDACKDEHQLNELNDYIIKFAEFNRLIDEFITLENETEKGDFVYWIELSSTKEDSNITLCSTNLDLSDYFRNNIFKSGNSCVLTSATLSINESFEYFKSRLGAESAHELRLPTQFDFYKQVKIYIPRDIPIPRKESDLLYKEKIKYWIEYFIKMTKGKALILFTNSALMKKISFELKNTLSKYNIQVFTQGEGLSRKNLLNSFKEDTDSVLFGLDSFWIGIDVPGESLSNLIITKLPFQVPEHPLIRAKIDYIEKSGQNSFNNFILPEAILKFRQGIGRLIRNKNDKGIIAILDTRIISRPYGKFFINSIEPCPIELI